MTYNTYCEYVRQLMFCHLSRGGFGGAVASLAPFLLAGFLLTGQPADLAAAELTKRQQKEFVEAVLFDDEYGPDRTNVIRWKRVARVKYSGRTEGFSSSFREARAVTRAIGTINRILVGSGMSLGRNSGDEFEIEFFFAPRYQFYEIAKYIGIEIDVAHPTMVFSGRNGDGSFRFATILIDNETEPEFLDREVLRALLVAVGLNFSVKEPSTSFFYSDRGFPGIGQSLTDLDRRVIKFLYHHLEAGDDREDVRAAFDKHWHTLD